jgi:hypothetical protein
MPQFDTETREKLAELRELRQQQIHPEVYEMCRIDWPAPTGPVYYATLQVDEAASVPPPVSPIATRLIPNGTPNWFLPASLSSSIGDEEVDLQFWDGDGVFSQLLHDHGEGIRVELMYWFPQVELLLPAWQGHLRAEDAAEVDIVPVKAVQGFRSADSDLPHRAHWQECQAIFGGVFDTQEEIDEHEDCNFNAHIGGGIGTNDPRTGLPWRWCDRQNRDSCILRGVDPNRHLSHATIQSVVVNNQSKGPRLYSTSAGNETNLKEPVRVVMGIRRVYDMKLMAYRKDLNNNNPDHGWFMGLYECCEGPVDAIMWPKFQVDGIWQDAVAMHYGHRLGHAGQTPVDPGVTIHSYSGTAHIRYNFGWIDPRKVEPNEATATAVIIGLNNIRVYSDADTYAEQFTLNRAWHIAHALTNKRWGFGYDHEQLHVPSWIEAAEWCDQNVRFTDPLGNVWDHVRGRCDVELIAKKVQQQVEDLCMAGRLSRPFWFDGKLYIVPLRALTGEELEDCPVFTDAGDAPNIVWDGPADARKSTLKITRKSGLDLPNRIECVYDDWTFDHLETPLQPVEDVDAQLRAGRVTGNRGRKINTKKHSLLGVTFRQQAMKVAWSLLDLGEFDEGGLANNVRVSFTAWFADALDLHPYKVIRVNSPRLAKYGFVYFRIVKLEKGDDLTYKIEAQAYNEAYMATFETNYEDIEGDPPPDPDDVEFNDTYTNNQEVLIAGNLGYGGGFLTVEIVQADLQV